MIWWIVGGVLILGVVLLVLVMMSVVGRLRPLNRAQRRLRLQAEQAEKLQAKVNGLQERAAELQSKVDLVTERAERLHARSGQLREAHPAG